MIWEGSALARISAARHEHQPHKTPTTGEATMGNMTHAIGLCVPFVNDSSYIERVCELADVSVGGQSSIYEVYGSFPDDLVGNLRPSETVRPITVAQLEDMHWIRPEDLPLYAREGVSLYKLDGRDKDASYLLEVIRAYLRGSYGCLSLTICGVIKFVRVVVKYGIKPSVLWGKLKPLCLLAFASGNISTIMKDEYELCEKGLGITPQFTSLWIPMSQAMLSPRAAHNFVIPPFLILKYIDTPVSASAVPPKE